MAKQSKLYFAFLQRNKSKRVKKGQKLQIWSQKSQNGNKRGTKVTRKVHHGMCIYAVVTTRLDTFYVQNDVKIRQLGKNQKNKI